MGEAKYLIDTKTCISRLQSDKATTLRMRILGTAPARNSAAFDAQLADPPPADQLEQEHRELLAHWRTYKRHTREWGKLGLDQHGSCAGTDKILLR